MSHTGIVNDSTQIMINKALLQVPLMTLAPDMMPTLFYQPRNFLDWNPHTVPAVRALCDRNSTVSFYHEQSSTMRTES